jgi:hypothetical protein
MDDVEHVTRAMPDEQDPERGQEAQSLREVLTALVGRAAIISNPEALRTTALGHQIKAHADNAKIISVRKDIVVVLTERGDENREPSPAIRQFIPLRWIKLVCVAPEGIHIHI